MSSNPTTLHFSGRTSHRQRLASLDWEAIERDYRSSQFSLREIQTRHGASPQSILRRATKYGWQRDLTKPIKAATKAALVHAEVNQRVDIAEGLKKAATVLDADAMTIAAAAEIGKSVVMQHRSELAEGRLIGTTLLQQFRTLIAEQISHETDDGESASSDRPAARLLGLVKIYEKLMNSVARIQAAERVAHGLDEPEADTDKVTMFSRISPIERASRIEAILEKARFRRTEAALGITLDETDGAWVTKQRIASS